MVYLVSYDNKLYKKGKDIIKIGDPISIEYKRIKLVSNKFDIFGSSQIMIVNYVKTVETKEKTMQTITYYDENAKPVKESIFGRKKTFEIGPFDPSQYGNPICYYTPAYKGENITINTQIWEIDKKDFVNNTSHATQSCLSLGKATPYGTYFDIANTLVGYGSKILTATIKHKELCPEHIIEFDNDNNIYEGLYVCFPEIRSSDLNERNNIIKNYFVEDMILVKHGNTGYYEEYDKTYYILNVTKTIREDLTSFDYLSSSTELITLLNSNDESFSSRYMETMAASYDLDLIKKISDSIANNDLEMADILFKHVPASSRNMFKSLFGDAIK